MTPYQFQSEDFALSEAGIHLLRNNFNFKTIPYDQVETAIIRREAEVKRPLIILLIGMLMLCFAVKQTLWVLGLFTDPQTHTIYIESIVVIIIPGVLGIYCLFAALKKGPVFKLKENKGMHKLRLRSVFNNNQSQELTRYLDAKLGSKLQIDE